MREGERLVVVATFQTEFEASVARGALESIGIPAVVPTERLGSFTSMYGGGMAAGPAHLKVFESDRVRAIAELRRMQMHVVRLGDEQDPVK
jgi:hypothetical protein